MTNPHAYPAGALILFTCGEYSDYGHHGLCRTTAPSISPRWPNATAPKLSRTRG